MAGRKNPGFVYRITLIASMGGLLFGYNTAVVAGAIGLLEENFGLSPAMKGWVTSCALAGCIIGIVFAGWLSDRIGRKKVLLISAIFFILSSAGTATAPLLSGFILFRIAGGFGIGIVSVLAPLYIAEIAPAGIRGRLVSMNQLGVVTGMLLIYFMEAFIANLNDHGWNVLYGWRWMFGSGAVPSMLFLILVMFIPESPRWLTKAGRLKEARQILVKINGNAGAEPALSEIMRMITTESGSFSEVFRPKMRKPLLIGILLAVFSQITGINAILYYAPEIFKSTGGSLNSALLQTILIGVINLLFTFVAVGYADKAGRKGLLMAGSVGMAVCLAVTGMGFYSGGNILTLLAILLYIACFAVSFGPVTFVLIAEIFPDRTRGKAMSVSVIFLWIAVFAVSQLFPVLTAFIGFAFTFWFFMVMAVLAILFTWKFVPETKGKTLEEIQELLS